MIIIEREDSYLMVTQNDHAHIAGSIGENCKEDYFFDGQRKREVLLAVREHDRGWIELDSAPVWNDKDEKPYSFIDYPTVLRLSFYKKGLNEVENWSKYAALLCSLHYSSFLQDASDPTVRKFWNEEKQRQDSITKELKIAENKDKQKILMYHLDLLKFCDFLSLYICLNEPGENEKIHPFFQNGFPQLFPYVTDNPIVAQWENQETVSLSYSPLKENLHIELPYKEITKAQIEKDGILQAYEDSPVLMRKVSFI